MADFNEIYPTSERCEFEETKVKLCLPIRIKRFVRDAKHSRDYLLINLLIKKFVALIFNLLHKSKIYCSKKISAITNILIYCLTYNLHPKL